MHILAAFSQSITNGVTNSAVNGVIDQALTLDASNRIQSPGNWQVLAATAIVPNLSAARLNSPSLRGMNLPQIYPGVAAASVGNNVGPAVWGQRGPRFAQGEYFTMEVSRAGAGALVGFGGVWIAPQLVPAPAGPTYPVLATCALTTVIGSWVLGTLVFDQVLPAGRYAVVGLAVVATGGVFARLVYPGVSQFRPGVICQTTYGDVPWGGGFRMGEMGSFGEFLFNVPPNIEILGSAAGAITATVYLDLVKVG